MTKQINRIPDHLHQRALNICTERGLSFNDMRAGTFRKAIETRKNIIFMLRKDGITMDVIANYLFMRWNDVLGVVRNGDYRIKSNQISNDIQTVMNEEIHDPSRKKAGW